MTAAALPRNIAYATLSLSLVFSAWPASTKPRPYLSLHHKIVRAALPAVNVSRANADARVEPSAEAFVNANQIYAYADGALFQVYTSLGKVTDIGLQPGERLVGTGPVAAGDTVRWIIGDTESGQSDSRQVHILVKPTQLKTTTNLVINTDRRTYHIELHAVDQTYMAAVSWRYPQDQLLAVQRQAEAERASAPVAHDIDPGQLNFNYRVEGDTPAWRPVIAFDDGKHVFIQLPAAIGTTDLPPLFVTGPGGAAELVNYRVSNRYFIVDRLFDSAELRLGDKHGQKIVRIRRTAEARS